MTGKTIGLAPLIMAALLFACQAVAGPHPWLRPSGPVADNADILSANAENRIRKISTDLWRKTGASIVVATVPCLDGQTIEGLAVELFKKWGVGDKNRDDGLLILLAKNERKVRIEVGYGLEGIIPDILARRIHDRLMLPHLKNGDFDRGLTAGVQAAAQLILANQGGLPGGGKANQAVNRDFSLGSSVVPVVLLIVIGYIVYRMRRGGPVLVADGSSPAVTPFGKSLSEADKMRFMNRTGGFGGFGGGFGGFGGGMSGGGGFTGGF